jgi:hypothetical protein
MTSSLGMWLSHHNLRVRILSCLTVCKAYPLIRHLESASLSARGAKEKHLVGALDALGNAMTTSEGRCVAVQLNVAHVLLGSMLLAANRSW